ncbi:hypothetical protein [Corynebacterium propinquum]
MSFQLDKNAIEKLAKAKLAEEAKSWNKELEKLARQMNGRPRSEIKPKLQALMNKLGLKLEHAQIDYFAEAIEQGKIPRFDAR